MKKLLSLVLAMTMLLCTACGGNSATNDTNGKTETSSNVFTEITGIEPNETVLLLGETEAPASPVPVHCDRPGSFETAAEH